MLTDLQKRTAQAIVNIFETGRVQGEYGKVTLIPGDPGHLTYGRSQTTLASGNLHLLIKDYCETAGAALASRLRRYLPGLAARDTALDTDTTLRGLLEEAGDDPVMCGCQDRFFDRVYWNVAVQRAANTGIASPLGTTVVYDSTIHGAWGIVQARTSERHGNPADVGEEAWVTDYVAERRDWLATHSKPVLHATVYRMDAFQQLIQAGNWVLPLPLRVRGVTIDEEALMPAAVRVSADEARTLMLRRPPMKGADVKAVQHALVAAGYAIKVDGVFGKGTDTAVRQLQEARGLKVDGVVGPATRSALGL
jgi:chitosanase